MTVVDTSVLAAFMSEAEPHHDAARERLVERGRSGIVVISVITYAEILVGAFRAEARGADRVERMLKELALVIQPVTEAIAVLGARLRAGNPSLRLADALILGTAEALGADTVLTADKAWRRVLPIAEVIG